MVPDSPLKMVPSRLLHGLKDKGKISSLSQDVSPQSTMESGRQREKRGQQTKRSLVKVGAYKAVLVVDGESGPPPTASSCCLLDSTDVGASVLHAAGVLGGGARRTWHPGGVAQPQGPA